jgi:hypothetical protein
VKIAAFDHNKQFMAWMTPGAAERALARGEASRIGKDRIALRPSRVEDLRAQSPEEKRRAYLAAKRARGNR